MSSDSTQCRTDGDFHVRRILFLIGLVVLSESLSSTILLPFVYFMVRDFGINNDERLIGSRAGFISNIAVARTSVGELAVQLNLDQAKAFSLFGFCSALGFVVGPLIGGSLSNPAQSLGISGPNHVFVKYPYLLPCIVGSMLSGSTFIASIFFLDETNAAVRSRKIGSSKGVGERQPLLSTQQNSGSRGGQKPNENNISKPKIEKAAFWCIVGASLMCFHSIIFDELFPLFAAASSEGNVGLGYDASQIASSLSLMGGFIFISQLILYPILNKHSTTLHLWRMSTTAFIVIYPLFPLIPRLLSLGYYLQKIVLLSCMASRFTLIVIAYTSINILVSD
ncbi:hypothetical protein AA313_de0200239 [Arthrobotrys entomopaga]|nr:hypothetical protein AA313_de0200239 [Arthrobotrys entomopaga]